MITKFPPVRHSFIAALMLVLALAAGCSATGGDTAAAAGTGGTGHVDENAMYVLTKADTAGLDRAIFAGGCFWCEETAFEGVPGVKAVISGFDGGREAHPTYEQVSSGSTGHAESVLVTYDPKQISYTRLLQIFWVNHDPTTHDREFCDRGHQYRPAIFTLDADQKKLAEASVAWARAHLKVDEPIVTEISPATPFWPAENYHQDFYRKNPVRYRAYRLGCGRDARLARLWGADMTGSAH
jgi:peptide-methionine (S)-S-oxide reductase